MKKIILLFFIGLLCLMPVACNKQTTDTETTGESVRQEETEPHAPDTDTESVIETTLETDAETTTELTTETEEMTEPHTHTYGEWSVDVVPTCTDAGRQTKSCACGDIQTEDIPALGHTEVVDAIVAPTCTETGLTDGNCQQLYQ